MTDCFLSFLGSQLAELQCRLAAEHQASLSRLEKQLEAKLCHDCQKALSTMCTLEPSPSLPMHRRAHLTARAAEIGQSSSFNEEESDRQLAPFSCPGSKSDGEEKDSALQHAAKGHPRKDSVVFMAAPRTSYRRTSTCRERNLVPASIPNVPSEAQTMPRLSPIPGALNEESDGQAGQCSKDGGDSDRVSSDVSILNFPVLSAPLERISSECSFTVAHTWALSNTPKFHRPYPDLSRCGTRSVDLFSRRSSDDELADGHDGWRAFMLSYIMLGPFSWSHGCWQGFSVPLILYDTIAVPLQAFDPEEAHWTIAMDWIIRIFWTLDIFVSFVTGYIDDEGCTILCPIMVAKRYIARQLHFDLTVVGIDWIQILMGIHTVGVWKSWRILRIVRFLRLQKAKDILAYVNTYMCSERLHVIASIVKMLVILALVSHLVACLWYGLGVLSGQADEPGWRDRGRPLIERYMQSFHFAITIFFGEYAMEPTSLEEFIFVSACSCLTFTLQIWFVSFVTTAMTHLEIISTQRSADFSLLTHYLANNGVTQEMAMKVKHSARHALEEQERNAPEASIVLLKLMSDPLLMELHFEIYQPIIRVHPFFKCYIDINPMGMCRVCHTAMAVLSVSMGDILFTEWEVPQKPRMLFVVSGGLEYVTSTANHRKLSNSDWVSEACLWTSDWIHAGTLRAEGECRLLEIDAVKFQTCLTRFCFEPAQKYAQGFVKMISEQEVQTDVGEYTPSFGRLLYSVFPDEVKFSWQDFDPRFVKVLPPGIVKLRRNSVVAKRGSILVHQPSSSVCWCKHKACGWFAWLCTWQQKD